MRIVGNEHHGFWGKICLSGIYHGSSLKGVGKSEFGGGSAVAQGGSRLA